MTRTYMTVLPDRAGALLKAARIIAGHGGSMRRASYNKAIDAHMLFLDVEAGESALDLIGRDLQAAGFLATGEHASVVLVALQLPDVPGALIPVLSLLEERGVSISYLSSQSAGSEMVAIKMGLYVEDPASIDALVDAMSALCPVEVLHYGADRKKMDNAAFYLNFAEEMRELLGFGESATREFITMSNRVMQLLDDKGEPHGKIFEYVSRFAHFVAEHHGESFQCRVTSLRLTERVTATVIEPPCGSNIILLEDGDSGELLAVDGGFICFAEETMALIRSLFPHFDERKRAMLLTHSDSDHTGLSGHFDRIYCTRRTADCFAGEHLGLPCPREENPNMLPYYRLSKIITDYVPPRLADLVMLDSQPGDDAEPLSPVGQFTFADMVFTVMQGNGGHVPGETVLLDHGHRIALTGDDFINGRDMVPDQKEFNRLAPYLARSVNQDSPRYHAILKTLRTLLDGEGWLILPGHGAPISRETRL